MPSRDAFSRIMSARHPGTDLKVVRFAPGLATGEGPKLGRQDRKALVDRAATVLVILYTCKGCFFLIVLSSGAPFRAPYILARS